MENRQDQVSEDPLAKSADGTRRWELKTFANVVIMSYNLIGWQKIERNGLQIEEVSESSDKCLVVCLNRRMYHNDRG